MNAKILKQLFDVIIGEAENNPEFNSEIEKILYAETKCKPKPLKAPKYSPHRDPPVLNPLEVLSSDGEECLTTRLTDLTEKQLKEVHIKIAEEDLEKA